MIKSQKTTTLANLFKGSIILRITSNMKTTKIIAFFILLLLGGSFSVQGQSCSPQADTSTAPCVNSTISFSANSSGRNTFFWDFGEGITSADKDPAYAYSKAGTYMVKYRFTGPTGACEDSFKLVVKPSPKIFNILTNSSTQCFEGNKFCFLDTTSAAPGSSIVKQTFIFDDGGNYVFDNPSYPLQFCHSVIDQQGGKYGLNIKAVDANGCVSSVKLSDYIEVFPKLGVKISSNAPIGCDTTTACITNLSTLPFDSVKSFIWDYGDGTIDTFYPPADSNAWKRRVCHLYKTDGTFDARLTVEAKFGCIDSFTYKAAATNFVLEPKILASMDTSCTGSDEVTFEIEGGMPPGSQFLWNFGNPPWPPNVNFDNQNANPTRSHPNGPWMISCRIVQGPCDVMAYDTILRLGPASTIEIPMVTFIPEEEKYQCIIRDSIHFTNASSFFGNDDNIFDEVVTVSKREPGVPVIELHEFDTSMSCNRLDTFLVRKLTRYHLSSITKDTMILIGQDTSFTINGVNIPMFGIYQKDTFGLIGGVPTKYTVPADTIFLSDTTLRYFGGNDSVYFNGQIIYDSIVVRLDSTYEFEYAFNYDTATRSGDQTAIPYPDPPGTGPFKTHVYRLWSFGDQYAPQCTTDTRAGKNIGKNCNFSLDSLPVHWYTPWETTYYEGNNFQFISQPVRRTLLSKNARQCFDVNVWPDSFVRIPDVLDVFVPTKYSNVEEELSKAVAANSAQIFEKNIFALDTFVMPIDGYILLPAQSVIYADTNLEYYDSNTLVINDTATAGQTFNALVKVPKDAVIKWISGTYYSVDETGLIVRVNTLSDSIVVGPTISTVVDGNIEKYKYINSGVVEVINVATNPQNITTYNGPTTFTLESDDQFTLETVCDTLFPEPAYDFEAGRLITATASTFIKDTVMTINGELVDTFVVRQQIVVDPAFHRSDFYQNTVQCFNVSLYHKDTVTPPFCEATGNVSLALMPPNAEVLVWESGEPCPFDPARAEDYTLQFHLRETKPGCSQQWFEVNFDSLAGKNNWVNYKSGGILAPPKTNPSPLPFIMPYPMILQWGTTFVQRYTANNLAGRNTKTGSFTLGLIIGNGPPNFLVTYDTLFDNTTNPPSILRIDTTVTTTPIAPECTDTAWYSDIFRINLLSANFEMISPNNTPRYICFGDTAYIKLHYELQDGIQKLEVNHGYQIIKQFTGENTTVDYSPLDQYYELFEYFAPYKGPSPTRNDSNINYDGEDWHYNFVVRYRARNFLNLNGKERFYLETLDTIVTAILRDFVVKVDDKGATDAIIEAFESEGLDYRKIPKTDVAYYLGDGTYGCVDTSGFSDDFEFRNERITYLTKRHDEFVYQYTDSSMSDSTIIEQILHFRDSSLQGYDTMITPRNLNMPIDTFAQGDTVPGVYKLIYRMPIPFFDSCASLADRRLYENYYPDVPVVDTLIVPSKFDNRGNPTEFDTIPSVTIDWEGPMVPNVRMLNIDNCETRANILLNVGYFREFKTVESLCEGQTLRVEDSIRYYAADNGDAFPQFFPIDPRGFWEAPSRFAIKEKKYIDYDTSDAENWRTSVEFREWTYSTPGPKIIRIATEDSLGCRDTSKVKVYVTDVIPNFYLNDTVNSCDDDFFFFDSSYVLDPCRSEVCADSNSLRCDSVVYWEWDFGDGTQRSLLRNPAHVYTSRGYFSVKLKVRSALGCEDSIIKQVYIIGPEPEFEFLNNFGQGDSITICLGDSVFANNISPTPTYPIDDSTIWYFNWGDSSQENARKFQDTAIHVYKDTGVYYVYLRQSDKITGFTDRCDVIFPDPSPDILEPRYFKVTVLPRLKTKAHADKDTVCVKELVTFTDSSNQPLYTEWTWLIEEDSSTTEIKSGFQVTHRWQSSGLKRVILIPDWDDGDPFTPECPSNDTIYVYVDYVKAEFEIDSSYEQPEFKFINLSSNAVGYEWDFDYDAPFQIMSTEYEPVHNYGEVINRNGGDEYDVWLIAVSAFGCKDTFRLEVKNEFLSEIIPYNVFTPNGDGDNDFFNPSIEGHEEYSIKIFNRWGELVFESEDSEVDWDGTVMNKGKKECPQGVYFYILEYRLRAKPENDGLGPISGQVTLLRDK